MPPRPEGTDGSDWSYREVVEDRYKRMAVNMSATLVLHQVQTLIVVLKLAWACIPIYTGEGTPNQFFYAWAVLLLLGNVCFYLGKPRGRCILPYMKVAVTCVLLTMALTFIGIWKMYMLEPKTSMLSRRLFKYLKDTGRVTSIKALDTFTTIEGLIDAATLAACGVCFFVFNNWVKDAMEVVKERDERNKAAGGGATAAKAAGLKKRR